MLLQTVLLFLSTKKQHMASLTNISDVLNCSLPVVLSEETISVCGKPHDHTHDHMHNSGNRKLTDIKNNKDIPIVWFVLGPIGAGKSSYINTLMRSNNLVYLSADVLKRESKLSYTDTRILMEKIIHGYIEKRISFITEGTGQHDDLYDLFIEYKRMEIDLRVTFIDVDLDVALLRNKNRTRVLDDLTVREVHCRCMERRHRWAEFGCQYINYKDLLSHSQSYDHVY